MKRFIIFAVGCFLLFPVCSMGQAPRPSSIVFRNYDEQMAGDIDYNYIQFATDNDLDRGWKITVQATGNFRNLSNQRVYVAPNHVSVRFNSVDNAKYTPGNTAPIPLSTAEVVLMDGMPAGDFSSNFLRYDYDFIVNGGAHLLLPNGTYQTNLILRLYNNGMQVGSANFEVSFEINVDLFRESNNTYYGLRLQNGANKVTLNFNEINDYETGVSVTIPDGLKVLVERRPNSRSYSGYNVIVHTLTAKLTSPKTSAAIPVSVVRLKTTSNYNQVTENTVTLSTGSNVFLYGSYNVERHSRSELLFDLKYFIPAGEAAKLLEKPGGSYTTQVFFTMMPK